MEEDNKNGKRRTSSVADSKSFKPRLNNTKAEGAENSKYNINTEDISSMTASKKAIITTFSEYRDTLDAHYDQRERIIKCSRDVTALSKKIVFALLRITQDSPEKVFKDAEAKHAQVLELFKKLSKELQGSDACRYNRQATPGIQEYIEAIGLWHFLQHDRLITMDQVLERLSVDGQPLVTVTDEDYLLGVSDLPGEVNRYCINAIGKGDHEAVKRCLEFLRLLKEGISMVMCSCHSKELAKKQPVLNSSLEKIEKTYYSMAIRETELHSIGAMNVDNLEQANIIS